MSFTRVEVRIDEALSPLLPVAPPLRTAVRPGRLLEDVHMSRHILMTGSRRNLLPAYVHEKPRKKHAGHGYIPAEDGCLVNRDAFVT